MCREKLKIPGFTLLEILIALFIFTIVSAILAGALHSIFTTQAAVEKRVQSLTELQIALLVMSRDIEQTIDRPISLSDHSKQGFIGSSSVLVFTHAGQVNPFAIANRSTLQRVRYELEEGNLVRVTWPMLDRIKDNADKRILLKNVAELNFQYLDSDRHFQKNGHLRLKPILPSPLLCALP